MLVESHSSNFCNTNVIRGLLIGLVAISPLSGNPSTTCVDPSQCEEYGWAVKYLQSINENTPMDEIADFLVSLRASLIAKGYQPLPLTEMFGDLHRQLVERGVSFNLEEIQYLYECIAEKESESVLVWNSQNIPIVKASWFGLPPLKRNHKEKKCLKKKEVPPNSNKSQRVKRKEPNSKTAIGFMFLLGGALLFLVPGAQGAATVLMSLGAEQCAEGLYEQSKENEQKQGPLANPPAQHDPANRHTNYIGQGAEQGMQLALNPPPPFKGFPR